LGDVTVLCAGSRLPGAAAEAAKLDLGVSKVLLSDDTTVMIWPNQWLI
jgi:hypothetical protein